MTSITVTVEKQKTGDLFFEENSNQYCFNYTNKAQMVSLTMPYKPSTYQWQGHMHPIFDMNMPEGYLFELLKNHLIKQHAQINDYLIFSYLCNNIQSRLMFDSNVTDEHFSDFDLAEVLKNDSEDMFVKLVKSFLGKNAISGVQPKTLALLTDKESLSTTEYIIKTWGVEYSELALNEYFCLKAVELAGVVIPKIQVSQNNRFLIVERFNLDKKSNCYLGFEEVLCLLHKNRQQKYDGSYEQVAKVIYAVVKNKNSCMAQLYKTIVMSYLLKNGDAHLKNFGVLYDSDMSNIRFAPAYDVVNTCVYFYKDRPALTMFGKKVWFGKKELVKFGVQHCFFSRQQALKFYDECIVALNLAISNLQNYILEHKEFNDIGAKMLDCWQLSLNEKTYKELPSEVIRHWS